MVKFIAVLVALFIGVIGGFVVGAIGGTFYLEFFGDGSPGAMSRAFAEFGPKGAIAGAVLAMLAMWRQLRKSPEKYASLPTSGAPRADIPRDITPPPQT